MTFTPRITDLVTMFQSTVREHGSRRSFGRRRDGRWEWLTWAELGKKVQVCRAALAGLGVGRGDRVAVISANRLEWLIGCHAAYSLGAVYVPMYEAQIDEDQRFILGDCGARVCLVGTQAQRERVQGYRSELPELAHLFCFDAPESDPGSFAALMARGAAAPGVSAVIPAPSDTAYFIYTSGTTGRPKGVMLTHLNLTSNVYATLEMVPFGPDDVTLAFLPWAHLAGASSEIHAVVAAGSSSGINDRLEDLLRNLGEVRPTIMVAVPRVWNRVYEGLNKQLAQKPAPIRALFRRALAVRGRRRDGQPLSLSDRLAERLADALIFSKIRARLGGRMRFAISGAAAISPEVARFIDGVGIRVFEAYGMTETSSVATATRPGAERIGSVGKPIPGVTVKLDHDVPGGDAENGEVVIYGHGVMKGYHHQEQLTRESMTADGGMRSGDLGRFDADGFLFITGRVKEIYKLENGKYCAPAPLEETITLSPYVAQAMVYGANRPFNVALLVPNVKELQEWGHGRGLPLDPGALLPHPATRELLQAELDRLLADARPYERVKRFALASEEFTVANDLLTPTLKLKRRNVLKKYQPQLDALYA